MDAESGMSIKKAINANGLKYLLSLRKMLTAYCTQALKRKSFVVNSCGLKLGYQKSTVIL